MTKSMISRTLAVLMALMLIVGTILPTSIMGSSESELQKKFGHGSSYALKKAIEEQESFYERSPALHNSLQGLDGDKNIPVIVHFSKNPVAVEKGKHRLNNTTFSRSEKESVVQKIQKEQRVFSQELEDADIQAEKRYIYNNVLNGMALTLAEKDVEKLLDLSGVIYVEPDEERVALSKGADEDFKAEVSMNSSISHLNIEKVWNMGYEGEGIKVGVIDTGIDYNHPEFADVYKGGKNFVEHNEDKYLSPRDEDDPYETSPLDRPDNMDPVNSNGSAYETSHGTHVAGIIAAGGVNDYGIKGLAPKVDLYAYRVLGHMVRG
ncbi:Subtilisin-like serine protease [Lentibacillus sp. JNUCC-1]|uniref:S8 family serine peptidase n=1 Tax=Lentibacillus sp. JNUCC-1 TaxID=2654513 RepID=UPI0012E7A60F|nr:S8 family serine peptidase [Lentibacillus sp. JNUCC-1]MUV37311.1 Subtilisin-like serine protease [Lentibacillus sp. JNUCC-1]